jgi:hypothetical protein
MRRISLKRLTIGFISACTITIISFVFLNLYSRHEAQQASAFIGRINQLPIGSPSSTLQVFFENVKGKWALTTSMGATGSTKSQPEEQWGAYFGFPYRFNAFLTKHALINRLLSFAGVRPWMVQATITTYDSKVTRIYFLTFMQLPTSDHVMSIVEVSNSDLSSWNRDKYRVVNSTLRSNIPFLHAYISPELPISTRSTLAAHDLSCFYARRSCTSSAELAPELWQAYLRQSASSANP